jgi:Sulfotransferase domain|nr:sulfotransferase family protein [Pseudohalocynthiibacter sp. F2068]
MGLEVFVTLKVIGTGFGRTGTDSMRAALNILGVGPTHHMFELEEGMPLRQPWLDLAKGSQPDWDFLFSGYHACVDWPSAYYWRSLIKVYPEAKVLLTMRSAESWWNSFEATILKYIQSGDDPNGLAKLLVAEQVFDGRPDDRNHAIATYNRNIEEVIATVDTERLLIHSLGDGWEPLCNWLGLSVPEVSYPSGNTTQDIVGRFAEKGVDLS